MPKYGESYGKLKACLYLKVEYNRISRQIVIEELRKKANAATAEGPGYTNGNFMKLNNFVV